MTLRTWAQWAADLLPEPAASRCCGPPSCRLRHTPALARRSADSTCGLPIASITSLRPFMMSSPGSSVVGGGQSGGASRWTTCAARSCWSWVLAPGCYWVSWHECWPSVIGVDASREMQRVSRRNLAHHGLGARQPARVRARTQRIPLHDACCDSLVSTFPAPYIVDPATLAEAARVLRPAGRMIVVGLVVHADRRERSKHPELALHLHPPGEPAVEQFCRLAEDIGLQVRRLSRFDPPVRLPVLIVERRA